jgi:hypothetical protein
MWRWWPQWDLIPAGAFGFMGVVLLQNLVAIANSRFVFMGFFGTSELVPFPSVADCEARGSARFHTD